MITLSNHIKYLTLFPFAQYHLISSRHIIRHGYWLTWFSVLTLMDTGIISATPPCIPPSIVFDPPLYISIDSNTDVTDCTLTPILRLTPPFPALHYALTSHHVMLHHIISHYISSYHITPDIRTDGQYRGRVYPFRVRCRGAYGRHGYGYCFYQHCW